MGDQHQHRGIGQDALREPAEHPFRETGVTIPGQDEETGFRARGGEQGLHSAIRAKRAALGRREAVPSQTSR